MFDHFVGLALIGLLGTGPSFCKIVTMNEVMVCFSKQNVVFIEISKKKIAPTSEHCLNHETINFPILTQNVAFYVVICF